MSSPVVDEHEIEMDNFDAQAGVGDDEFVRDEDVNIDSAADGILEKKRVQGQTTSNNIHARSFEEREEVTFDKGQAMGPTDKRVSDLTNFIGTIARNPRFITLVHTSWHAVSHDIKRRMWEYVNVGTINFLNVYFFVYFLLSEDKYTLFCIVQVHNSSRRREVGNDRSSDAWRRHKRNIKMKYFNKNATDEDMLQNRPNEIPEVQFRQLIEYWKDSDVQRATKENNEEPSKSEMFIATRTKKGKEVHTDTQVAISELQNRQSFGETTDDALRAVFGKEQPGRVRCYGRSVTTSSLKKDEEITKLKQKHANEMTSLKEEMKEMLREEMRSFLSQVVQNNHELNFHDMQGCAGSNIPSPVDASSARAIRGQNLPHSSGSTHTPNLEKVFIFHTSKNLPQS
ncbi:PREDICTED: uncharacterized protein LOC109238428 [Nicotiana attenuata]|uniref:uncharacterized protein LOC109238428 n=1 Tax=Nicotiana attenuata TaxID=49451 RepID=UPI000904C5A7|nr:PREDICTED: uncharacterized protein LOC109238428 [Nicotiana attenuata]